VAAPLRLTTKQARRLSVQGQRLSGPRPGSIDETVHDLWMVQMDPTRVVARTEHLVLFSRLGRRFRIDELERKLWDEWSLFEYRAHILPTMDLAIHQEEMRRFPSSDGNSRHRYVAEWLRRNDAFRRYVVRELRRRGPLRTRDLENRAVWRWKTGGWNDEGNDVAMMLEALWREGTVMIAGRDGQQRLWDLAERRLPTNVARLPRAQVARAILDRQLRARGVATTDQFGWAFDGRPPGWERALQELVRDGIAVPAEIDGLAGDWYAHAEMLERRWRPRTVALSPFDDLVSDRVHTLRLFDFECKLEIYVPKAKRRWGYFVLPVLHGDRLIGRFDPRFDRETRVLHVSSVYAESTATRDGDGRAAARAIAELGSWLGAADVVYDGPMPPPWRTALRA
jgi:uncharacterized protein